MRRISATLLLAVLGFAAVIPLVIADPDFSRPACCRRDGKHQCTMMTAQQESSSESSGPVLRAARTTCPYFPSSGAVNAYAGATKPEAAPAFSASLVRYPFSRAQSSARYRTYFHRTHQKRGPPTVS
jgi:hypothetical protein